MPDQVAPATGAPAADPIAGTMDAAVEAEIARMQVGNAPDNGPADGADDPEPGDADNDAADASDEEQPSDDPNAQDGPEGDDADSFEYEKDGKRYTLPKALQDDVMLKSDYTRKRMEESRYVQNVQQREAQLPQLFQHAEQFANERGQLAMLDAQIAELTKTDWASLDSSDQLEFGRRAGHLQLLQMQRQQLGNSLNQRWNEFQQHQEGTRLQQANNTAAALTRDHAWTPQRHAVVQLQARKAFGHNPVVMQALHDGVDPAIYVELEKAAKWDALQAQKPAALKKADQPSRAVVVRSGAGSQPSQRAGHGVQQASASLKRTGSVQDAVALELARMGGGRRGR